MYMDSTSSFTMYYIKCMFFVILSINGSFTQDTVEKCESELCTAQDISELRINSLEQEVRAVYEKMTSLESKLTSTYVRWGRTVCPETATLLYDGKSPDFQLYRILSD